MKTYSIVLLILLSGCFCIAQNRQARQAKKTPDKAVRELMEIERQIGIANVNHDRNFFERIEADEFTFTDSNGSTTNKKEDLASMDKTSQSLLSSYTPDDMNVHVYGNCAVVTGRITTRGSVREVEFARQSRFTDVFVRRAGRWQLVAGHSSRIPQPQR